MCFPSKRQGIHTDTLQHIQWCMTTISTIFIGGDKNTSPLDMQQTDELKF